MRKVIFSILIFFLSLGINISTAQSYKYKNRIENLFEKIENLNQKEDVLLLIQEIETEIEKVENDSLYHYYIFSLGSQCCNSQQTKKCFEYMEAALEYYELTGDKRKIAAANAALGSAHQASGNFKKAIEYSLEALEYSMLTKDTLNMITAYRTLTKIHISHNVIDTTAVLKYGNAIYNLSIEYGKPREIGLGGFMGGIANAIGKNFDKATELLKTSSVNYLLSGDTMRSIASTAKIGAVLELQGRIDEAKPYYEEYYQISKNLPSHSHRITSAIYLANIYNYDTLNTTAIRTKTIPLLKEVLAIPEIKDMQYELANVYDNLVAAYNNIDDHKNALYYSQTLLNHKDRTLNESYSEAIAEMEAKYETAEKEREIAVLEKEKAISETVARNRIFGLFALISLLLLGGGIFYYRNRLKEQLRLQSMRSQISSDLHDEVGSSLTHLSMIMSSVEGSDAASAKNYLQKGNEILMSSISKIRDVVWAIDAQNDAVGNLIDRMEDFAFDMLKSKDIDYQLVIEGLDRKEVLPPVIRQNFYLIFKEAITNIVKHSDAGKVQIDFTKKGKNLLLKIADNGKDLNDKKVTGSGLSNMELRAKRIGGKVNISKNKNGFEVDLFAPID